MRESVREVVRETKRGAVARPSYEQSHRRSPSPEERTNSGGDGDDWTVVRVRRRKAQGKAVRGQDGIWELDRQEGSAGQQQLQICSDRLDELEYPRLCAVSDMEKEGNHQVVRRSVWDRIGNKVNVHNHNEPAGVASELKNLSTTGLNGTRNYAMYAQNSNSSELRRYVTYYFTNIPDLIPYFYVKEALEVCGILDNLFLSSKRNKQGRTYGFVRYANVRDPDKLLKAVNNVTFGQFRVRAKPARFKRKTVAEGGQHGSEGVRRKAGPRHGVEWKIRLKGEGEKSRIEGVEGEKSELFLKEEEGRCVEVNEEVLMGKPVKRKDGGKDGAGVVPLVFLTQEDNISPNKDLGQHIRKMARTYRSNPDDVAWARKGAIATVLNGEAIPVIQSRIADAGFEDFDIIPLGADKVYIRCVSNSDVMSVFESASDFFNLFFSQPVRWNKNIIESERGAWVRIYGIPIHAWNTNCFKLIVQDCGRLLKLDNPTMTKDRFDYARILLATKSLDVINFTEKIVIDGEMKELKIIEEWGFSLGEDACLLEEDDVDSNGSIPEINYENVAPDIRNQVADLVNNLADDWGDNESDLKVQLVSKEQADTATSDGHIKIPMETAEATEEELTQNVDSKASKGLNSTNKSEQQGLKCGAEGAGVLTATQLLCDKKDKDERMPRQSSCPPMATRSVNSGPWSLEWLQDHVHGSVGVVSSALKNRVKTGGKLKHSVHNFKKIARLPVDDRKQVLKILMKKVHRRRDVKKSDVLSEAISKGSHVSDSSSSESRSNDWKNWIVLNGKEEVVKGDVHCIGKALGVKFYNDKANQFRLLSRGRKQKQSKVETVEEGAKV